MNKTELKYLQAVEQIKTAILQSQYSAVRLVNQEQLTLYFSIGRYISENSRSGYWGTGALDFISGQLKQDLPGLMGFGVSSLKNMRKFYEAWGELDDKSTIAIAELYGISACRVFGRSFYSAHSYSRESQRITTNRWVWQLSAPGKICRRSSERPCRTLKS